jgi:hypothetical protein
MTAEATHRPRVLAVGAYERDNVGDLLFLLVTERCLRDAELVAAAPFGADMRAQLDRRVVPYGPLLRDERFDVIWTVGGQVGAVDVPRAYRMSAPPRAYRRYARGSGRRREALLRRAAGGPLPLSPYIPSALDHPRNAGAISVLNSVGLSGARAVEDPDRRAALVALLRGQTYITVRDRGSSRYLDTLGIEHALAPDAVHALGVLWPGERDPDADVAIVQISSAILRQLGHAEVGARIAASPALRGRPVRLLLAGTATGHDAVADYEALMRHAPGVDLAILEGRRPLDIVDQIRRARVVVGTSLHVRIIAAAYGVPRVSLSRWKPTQYARAWDDDMPYDVALRDLDAAIVAAEAAGRRPEVQARSAGLAAEAHAHLEGLARRVLARAAADTPADRAARADARRAHALAPAPVCVGA